MTTEKGICTEWIYSQYFEGMIKEITSQRWRQESKSLLEMIEEKERIAQLNIK